MDSTLAGKWALVTGASRGIGAGIARRLASEGVHLALHYRTHREGVEAVREDCLCHGVEVDVLQADLADLESAKALAEETRANDRLIQILVNNAGAAQSGPFWTFQTEEWDRIQRVNLDSPRILIQEFLPPMLRSRWGRIVNLSSVLSTWGGRGNSAYSVSKAGLNAMTRTVAIEAGRKGVTVNAVAPGLIDTDMGGEMGETMVKEIIDRTPLKRLGTPEEIAEAVVFLCRCGYVTGEVIYLDGGLRQAF